jgi:peptidoglycan hydrolase CwlO-like protein
MTLTPEQFSKLVTKDEHNELKRQVDKIDKNVEKLVTAVDGLAKKFDKFDQELTMIVSAHDRFQGKLDNHEIRIKKLEPVVG